MQVLGSCDVRRAETPGALADAVRSMISEVWSGEGMSSMASAWQWSRRTVGRRIEAGEASQVGVEVGEGKGVHENEIVSEAGENNIRRGNHQK